MARIIDEYANTTNPRSLCVNCWCIITRHELQHHVAPNCEVVSKQYYSGSWGLPQTTEAKIQRLARRAKLIENNRIPLLKLKISPATRIYPTIEQNITTTTEQNAVASLNLTLPQNTSTNTLARSASSIPTLQNFLPPRDQQEIWSQNMLTRMSTSNQMQFGDLAPAKPLGI